MNTIILFGASRGGMNFIENHQGEYTIAAVADNDLKKQGNMVHDIPIIAPNQIRLYTYDYIVITSMYVNSITEQLKKLNIQEDKIKYASKNSMKVLAYPFRDMDILNCANKMIITLSNILKNIRHFITFGTLLGIVRDGNLIPWDDDIDIAIFAEDALKIKELLLINIEQIDEIMNTKMYIRYYPNGNIASISIDCYKLNTYVFNINLDCIYVDGDMAKQELNITPLKYFRRAEKHLYKGHLINVPFCYTDYLKYTYGNWKIIKKDTSFNDNTLSFKEPQVSCESEIFYNNC